MALLWSRWRQTAARFPTLLPATLVAAIAALVLIDDTGADRWPRVLGCAVLGFSLLTGLHLVAELRVRPERRWWLPVAGLAGLVALTWGTLPWAGEGFAIRLVQWGLASHLLVAVAWVAGSQEGGGFWQFNRTLFERFLVASLYAVVLAIGLSVALIAIDRLFAVNIDGDTYPQIYALIGLVVHPWFFLAGVPREPAPLDRDDSYPTGLKIFAQYILIPLVTVYLVILTAYLGRVIITRVWPSGWIGWLVSSVALTGTLALLLVHPLRSRAEGGWVNGYGRWFFVALIPSLVMLAMALAQRVNQYGFTEPRYALMVLTGWLMLLAGYYGLTGSRSIRPIPISLAVVALATAFGPWGMAATARRSQVARFERIAGLERFEAADSSGQDDANELHQIGRYLWARHGRPGLAAVTGVAADTLRAWAGDDSTEVVVAALRRRGLTAPSDRYDAPFFAAVERGGMLPGVEVAQGVWWFGPVDLLAESMLAVGTDTVRVRGVRGAGHIVIRAGRDSGVVDLAAPVDSLRRVTASTGRLAAPVRVASRAGPVRVEVVVTDLSWSVRDPNSRHVSGGILVSRTEPGNRP